MNPSTLEMFGYDEDELLGQPTSILYADKLRRDLAGGKPENRIRA
ncbi:MAG: hypothetical protein CMI59_07990 [Parvibaculum sp.]|nr:hypothetical protein [Parvibaculum sp.]